VLLLHDLDEHAFQMHAISALYVCMIFLHLFAGTQGARRHTSDSRERHACTPAGTPAPSTSGREHVSPLLAVLTQLEQTVNPGGRLKHVQWEFKDVVVSAGMLWWMSSRMLQ